MKQILVIGGSSSQHSINRVFASYSASQIENVNREELDLNDYEMPLFSVDREKKNGIPQKAINFITKIGQADAVLISLAEHNGSYTSAFKNVLDWASRINDMNIWQHKPMLLLSTSPGRGGGSHVMEAAKNIFPLMKANIVATFSLPSYNHSFNFVEGIKDSALNEKYQNALSKLQTLMS